MRHHTSVNTSAKVAERGVAVLEFLKGFAVLAIAGGFATMLHREHDVEQIAISLLYVLHINHHQHLSAVFLRVADKLEDTNLLLVAAGAGIYCLLRFVEAYGLWKGRVWAEWLALISGTLYLPMEIYEMFRHNTPIKSGIFLLNVAIVVFIAWLRCTPKAHQY
jgi:uncharacterized membrane protein (DUF2068 family)